MPTYPYLTNARGSYQMDYREMNAALGITDKKVPADRSTSWTDVQGVLVRLMTSDEARQFWNKRGMALRVIAKCPDCGKVVGASRINQHARVHYNGVRKGVLR